MNMSHLIRPEFRDALAALVHPDHTTRVQTLEQDQDPELYALLRAFARRTGFPILVNTSLNRAGEPIAERARDALDIFVAEPDIDYLIVQNVLVRRTVASDKQMSSYKLHPGAILTTQYQDGAEICRIIHGSTVWTVSEALSKVLRRAGRNIIVLEEVLQSFPGCNDTRRILLELVNRGVLQRQ